MTTELAIREESHDLAVKVNGLIIKDLASFEATDRFGVDLQRMKKVMMEYHKPLKAATHLAHKTATKRERDDLAPLEVADKRLRSIRSEYVQIEEEKRRKAQEKLDIAAKKKADKQAAKLFEKAAKTDDPEEKQALEEEAEEVYIPPNIATGGIEKSSKVEGGGGVSWVDDIEVAVTDPMELINQVAGGRAPITLVEIKVAMIKRWVKTNGIKHGQIPGIAIKSIKVERVRTG